MKKDEILLPQIENAEETNNINEEDKSSAKQSKTVVGEVLYQKIVDIPLSNQEINKASSVENYTANEEEEFYKNEAVIEPLMEKLSLAVTENNTKEACIKLGEIVILLPTISPSFIELNGIGKLLIRTRKIFEGNEGMTT